MDRFVKLVKANSKVIGVVIGVAAVLLILRVFLRRGGDKQDLPGPLDEPNASRARVEPPRFADAELIHSTAPFLYKLKGFMTPEECRHFLEISANRFERSNVTGSAGTDGKDNVRTSHSCSLRESETPIVRRVEERAAEVCGVDVSQIEGLQIVRYHPGQKYDPHCDYFHHAKIPNQRYKTILVYLNDDFEGGTTRFVHPTVNKEVKPKTGDAAFWYNSWVPPNEKNTYYCFKESEHQGSPPTTGVKYAVNIWVRLKPYRGVV